MVAHNLAGYKPKMIKILAARLQLKVLKGPLNIGAFEFSVVKQRVQTAVSYIGYEEEKNNCTTFCSPVDPADVGQIP